MTFQNLFIAHDRTKSEEQWLEEEMAEQVVRRKVIVKAMDELAPQRDVWYAEFFERIQTRGFNHDGDARTKIKADDIPVKPARPHKVVY